MSEQTFTVGGRQDEDAVREWQRTLNLQLGRWGAGRNALKVDGVYGVGTRAVTADVLRGLGIEQDRMRHGVTPWLRTKVRERRLSVVERARYARRKGVRREVVARLTGRVHRPLAHVITDSWGWHPGVHDGVDLICASDALLFAMCDGVVVRADPSGWWGKAPSGDVSKGDGIIIIRCSISDGPFRPGLHICYGHAEHARVKVGSKVRAGQVIGRAGLAVVPHVHLMVNGLRADASGFVRGVGDRDPRPFYDYARKRG